MRKIMACLDVGSDTVKLVVGEMFKKKLNVLAVAESSVKGIKNGLIEKPDVLLDSIKKVLKKCEDIIGIRIRQMIVCVPSNNTEFSVVSENVKINSEGFVIDGKDISRAINKVLKNNNNEAGYVTFVPISFSLDDNRIVKDPKGLTSKNMNVRGVLIKIPKRNINPILLCLNNLDIDVLDFSLDIIGNYYEMKEKDLDRKIGAVINLGAESSTVGIFNKGVLTNSMVIDLGGKNIDNDISFVYKVPLVTAKELKENFALASSKMSQSSIVVDVEDKASNVITINQYEISEVVKSRLEEIIGLCKKEINNLTKKEISYIIFTGGLSEIKDFNVLLDELFKSSAIIQDIKEIGVRDNKYSSCLGLIKYYAYDSKLKDKDFSIFSMEEQQLLSGNREGMNDGNNVIGKLFSYIFNG